MIKGNIKLIGGFLAGMMIGGVTIVYANQAIQALQNTEIKVSLNGAIQTFKDETTGEVQYPITYNDRTYLPLRNIANLAGLSVDYDSSTNTAILESDADIPGQHDDIYELKLTEEELLKRIFNRNWWPVEVYQNGNKVDSFKIFGDKWQEKDYNYGKNYFENEQFVISKDGIQKTLWAVGNPYSKGKYLGCNTNLNKIYIELSNDSGDNKIIIELTYRVGWQTGEEFLSYSEFNDKGEEYTVWCNPEKNNY